MSEISDLVRRSFGESDAKRDAGLTTPQDVERFDDIVYGDDAKWQILDVYRPKEASGKNCRSSSVSMAEVGCTGIRRCISIIV